MNSLAMMQRVVFYQMLSTAVVASLLAYFEPALAYPTLGCGILMSVNLRVMSLVARRAMQGGGIAPGLALVIGFKFVFVLGAIGAGIKLLGWHPNGVALGIATIFTGVAFAMIHTIVSPPASPRAAHLPIDSQQQTGGPETGLPRS